MTSGLKRQIESLSRIAPGENTAQKRQAAIGSWAAMVGAMILARVSDDPELSGEVLDQTQAWLKAQGKNRGQRNAPACSTRNVPASSTTSTPFPTGDTPENA